HAEPLTDYRVILNAAPQKIEEGGNIQFQAFLAPHNDRAEYCFMFGDGTPCIWSYNRQADHEYRGNGLYSTNVTARVGDKIIARSETTSIEVNPVKVVRRLALSADRANISEGEPVKFSVIIDPPLSDVEFVFSFGDNDPQIRSQISGAEHRYRHEGIFQASAIAIVGGKRIASSPAVSITVTEHKSVAANGPPGFIIWYLAAGGLFIAFAYYVYFKMTHRRSIQIQGNTSIVAQPYPDGGVQGLKTGHSLTSLPAVRFKVYVDRGIQQIMTGNETKNNNGRDRK
ncbi:MAG TPA: hypothetical protein VMB78_05655, partial [Dissulfurispiraceae bacterium]|nr:hypothetical protein [Dissulfurispiraceae bacterium]